MLHFLLWWAIQPSWRYLHGFPGYFSLLIGCGRIRNSISNHPSDTHQAASPTGTCSIHFLCLPRFRNIYSLLCYTSIAEKRILARCRHMRNNPCHRHWTCISYGCGLASFDIRIQSLFHARVLIQYKIVPLPSNRKLLPAASTTTMQQVLRLAPASSWHFCSFMVRLWSFDIRRALDSKSTRTIVFILGWSTYCRRPAIYGSGRCCTRVHWILSIPKRIICPIYGLHGYFRLAYFVWKRISFDLRFNVSVFPYVLINFEYRLLSSCWCNSLHQFLPDMELYHSFLSRRKELILFKKSDGSILFSDVSAVSLSHSLERTLSRICMLLSFLYRKLGNTSHNQWAVRILLLSECCSIMYIH